MKQEAFNIYEVIVWQSYLHQLRHRRHLCACTFPMHLIRNSKTISELRNSMTTSAWWQKYSASTLVCQMTRMLIEKNSSARQQGFITIIKWLWAITLWENELICPTTEILTCVRPSARRQECSKIIKWSYGNHNLINWIGLPDDRNTRMPQIMSLTAKIHTHHQVIV